MLRYCISLVSSCAENPEVASKRLSTVTRGCLLDATATSAGHLSPITPGTCAFSPLAEFRNPGFGYTPNVLPIPARVEDVDAGIGGEVSLSEAVRSSPTLEEVVV
jgi:hypothetical protein